MAQSIPVGQKWWSGGRSPFNVSYGKLMMWYFLMSDAFTFGAFLITYGTIRFSQNYWPAPNHVFNAFPFAGHANLPLAFVSLMTFILIFSSVTMVLAVHAGHRMEQKKVENYMLLTIFGGLAFLSCQAWEWHHLLTGEHVAMLKDGSLNIVATTMSNNPWGATLSEAQIVTALQHTPHAQLVSLAGLHHEGISMATFNNNELISKIDPEIFEHIGQTGPPAFGGAFFGITGFHGFHVFSGVIINIIMYIKTKMGHFQERGHYEM